MYIDINSAKQNHHVCGDIERERPEPTRRSVQKDNHAACAARVLSLVIVTATLTTKYGTRYIYTHRYQVYVYWY